MSHIASWTLVAPGYGHANSFLTLERVSAFLCYIPNLHHRSSDDTSNDEIFLLSTALLNSDVIAFLALCQDPEGGYGGGPKQVQSYIYLNDCISHFLATGFSLRPP